MEISTKDCHKYLGLPTFLGREKHRAFNHFKEKLWQIRVENELLSTVSKKVFINVVCQSIPLYQWAFISYPKVFDEIIRLIRNFWWGTRNSNGVNWIPWTMLYYPRHMGVWVSGILKALTWLYSPIKAGESYLTQTLWVHVLCSSFMTCKVKGNISFTWKGNVTAHEILLTGLSLGWVMLRWQTLLTLVHELGKLLWL